MKYKEEYSILFSYRKYYNKTTENKTRIRYIKTNACFRVSVLQEFTNVKVPLNIHYCLFPSAVKESKYSLNLFLIIYHSNEEHKVRV